MAARDLGIEAYTMFKVNEGRVAIPRDVDDPVAYAQANDGVTVFKGLNWKTAIAIWNVKKGMLI